MELELRNALGLGWAEILPEPIPRIEPEPQPTVTIYDLADLLVKNEPPKKRRELTSAHLTTRAFLST
jgi:hypothetical protein